MVIITRPGDDKTLLRVAAVASVPLAWYLWRSRSRASATDYRTDFDGFLKRVEAPGSTGYSSAGQPSSSRARTSGSIDKFFRDAGRAEIDDRDPAVFDSFLKKKKDGAAPVSSTAQAPPQQQAKEERPEAHHVRTAVFFGTEYGFSKEVAERLSAKLKGTGRYWPVLVDMAEHGEGYDFSKEQVVLMACSTQGDGVPPTEAREFCEWLFAGKAGPLSHINYSVCAMGDRSYQHFCRCGKQLDSALAQAGGAELAPRADVHREDYPAVDAWVELVVQGLGRCQGLKTLGETGGLVADDAADNKAAAAAAGKKKWGKSRPYMATLVAQEGLCTLASKEDKNTLRYEFDLGDSGITYAPGDALGIYPTNPAPAVDELLAALGASGDEHVAVPSWHYQEEEQVVVERKDGKMSLREALARCYDIRSPKTDILKLMATLAEGAAANGNRHHAAAAGNAEATAQKQRAQLQALLSGSAEEQEAYFSQRHVIDVLQDFEAIARPSATQVLGVLRQLQPRLYSISSSPLEHPARVQTTVAEVKYKCLGRERVGVCSTYLSERLQVGTRVPVYVHKNPDFRLPAQASTPIIMVGPGTGLAPFRSFIMHRLMDQQQPQEGGNEEATTTTSSSSSSSGEMVLYFGCRRPDQDYLYGPVLEGWAKQGAIKLFTAFSRAQAQKVYVQDRLRESGALVWDLLQQGAHFYVCGDASSMAGCVERELTAIIKAHLLQQQQQQGGEGSEGEDEGSKAEAEAEAEASAKAYLQMLSDTGRYQRDVWY